MFCASTKLSAARDLRSRLEQAIRKQNANTAAGAAAIAEAHFRLSVLHGTHATEALRHLRAAIALDSLHPKYHFHVGRILHAGGDGRGAVCAYRQSLRLAPSSHRTWTHLGLALTDLGEPQKKLGQELLDGLFKGIAVGDFLPAVDELIRAWLDSTGKPPAGRKPGEAKAPKDECRYTPIGRVFLMEHLTRPKIQRRSVDKCLEILRGTGQADYALGCLQLMIAGDPPANVARMVEEAAKAAPPDQAAQLVLQASGLARETDPAEFVCAAEKAIAGDALPLDLVVWLHYSLFGPDSRMTALEALRTLDLYARELRRQPAMVELRIAILDGFARRAWNDQDFDRCRLLWREALALDPHRVEAAHNLALLAARAKSHEDYPSAWLRAVEVRYLQAAATGEILFGIEDRRLMHLTVLQQLDAHYLPKRNANREEQQKRMSALIRDQESLRLMLREFDLYYLNSRLGFRSPVHLLGIARDAAPENTEAARRGLNSYFDRSFASAKLAGGLAFVALAHIAVDQACQGAARNADRARDPYYEPEKPDADRFAVEILSKAFLFIALLEQISEGKKDSQDDDLYPLAARIFQTMSGLPWTTLHEVARRTDAIQADVQLCDIVGMRYLRMLQSDGKWIPRSEEDVIARLKQAEQDLSMVYPGTWPDQFRDSFECIAGLAATKALDYKLRSPADLEKLQAGLEKILTFVPRAHVIRIQLADLLIKSGTAKRVERAIELLRKGVEFKHEKETDDQIKELLAAAEWALPGARRADEVKDLLDPVTRKLETALTQLQDKLTPATLRAAADAAAEAVSTGEQAVSKARKAEDPDLLDEVEKALAQFREYKDQLKPLLKQLKE